MIRWWESLRNSFIHVIEVRICIIQSTDFQDKKFSLKYVYHSLYNHVTKLLKHGPISSTWYHNFLDKIQVSENPGFTSISRQMVSFLFTQVHTSQNQEGFDCHPRNVIVKYAIRSFAFLDCLGKEDSNRPCDTEWDPWDPKLISTELSLAQLF